MDIAFFILAAMLFCFAVYIGFLIGQMLGERAVTSADYWKLNAAAIIVAVLLTLILANVPLLYAAIIGALAGCILGLKMAFGESVGPWRVLDRFLNVNPKHRETARRGTGEARRARRRSGEDGPDLISVEDPKEKR